MTAPQSWGEAHQGPGGHEPGGGPEGRAFGQPPRNGFGVAALTLGVAAALLFWTVLGGAVLGLLALIFGIAGYRRGQRGEATNGTLALSGALVGGFGLMGSAVMLAFIVWTLSSGDYGELESCVREAATAVERKQCEEDFVKDIVP